MSTNNSINNASPNIAAHSIMLSQAASNQTGLLLTAGQVAIGTTASDPAGATITGSGNIVVTSTSGAIAISSTGTPAWVAAASSPVTGVVNTGYYITNASATTINVPATFPAGDVIAVVGNGAGGWTLQMNTGQVAHIGNQATSSAGSLASTNQYDCIEVLCVVSNTTFVVRSSFGNISFA